MFYRHARELVELSEGESLAARFAALAVPALFVAGVPRGICERSRTLLDRAGARWIGVEPAGHWVYLDQPARFASIVRELCTSALSSAGVRAVAIVNGAARRLGRRLRSKLEHALPGNVFTSSLDDARTTIRREIRRGVDLMIFGGGDGTVVMGLTLLGEACRGHARREPAIGVLRLGSGNAIADTLGAGGDVGEDLERLARGGGTRRELPLLEVLGVRAPFVGVGIDAQVLEDHAAVGELVDRVPGARAVGGGARYVLSVALRSIPRFALVRGRARS